MKLHFGSSAVSKTTQDHFERQTKRRSADPGAAGLTLSPQSTDGDPPQLLGVSESHWWQCGLRNEEQGCSRSRCLSSRAQVQTDGSSQT